MSDDSSGCFNPIGFDPDEIYAYKKKFNGLGGISRTLNKPEDILTQKCDIFIASDKEMVVTKSLAEKLKCKVLIEGCNAPCTKEALDVLRARDILVIPDILSFSGGFIVSYLEWLKNLEHRNLTLLFKRFESNSRKTLLKMLSTTDIGVAKDTYQGVSENELIFMTVEEIMDKSFNKVLLTAEEFDMDLKTAAFKIAIEKIYDQYKNTGAISI